MSKSILITTYHFYPEICPRAFRAFELAKEFAISGHNVTVYIPNYEFDYSSIENETGIKVLKINSGFLINRNSKRINFSKKNVNIKRNNFFKRILVNLLYFFCPEGNYLEFGIMLGLAMIKTKIKYDLLLSIALPFSTHVGCFIRNIAKGKISKVCIADYGDPFTGGKERITFFYYRYWEKLVLKYFDFITIPTKKSIEHYKYFKNEDCIKVIPQGYNFNKIKLAEYKPSKTCRFAYGGMFYSTLRNPKVLFEFLITLDSDFVFTIYTDLNDKCNIGLISPYIDTLGEKLVIRNLIPREKCIYELSKNDFLINQLNLSKVQVPSKLVDYGLTKRPIFSFSEESFDKELFMEFVHRNFKNFLQLDISEFSIVKVANQFLTLDTKYH